MKVLWTEQAFARLAAIQNDIAADNPEAAGRFVGRLIQRANSLARLPRMGRVVPELPDSDLRELVEDNYRIAYRIRARSIQVLTVFEAHRLFPAGNLPKGKS